ncbi:MAG: ErfK/YbiS/YcfS/YnhG family protein [Candidatus Berkelbacteria bacterium Licking1014_85]|uniref:ErfK/YbiS/YcfS/YnhG family protein n=1 Tax=Candidatus Berkelbacteria bacterium Licking1014_85 TaxID=2017148 RepID=A0A554LMH5_9BACT|nr:MAG: ErfK/YbiS/YcfS/YnhG family protein [Candidatus Berkelbacteria bacterium Licking1014_85]
MHQKIIPISIGIASFLITLDVSAAVYLHDKILPKTDINNISVAWLTKIQAYDKIKANYSNDLVALTYNNKIVYQGSRIDIGIVDGINEAINQAFEKSRNIRNIAIAKDILIPVNINESKLTAILNSSELIQFPKNAEIKIENYKLIEIPESAGLEFNVADLIAQINANPYNEQFGLAVIEKQPTIKLADLQQKKSEMQKIIDKQLAELKSKQEEKLKAEFTPGLFNGKYLEIDLSSQTLAAYEGQNKVKEYRVSSGKSSMPTPSGTYTINNKADRAYSAKYGLYMPHWMAFIGSKYGLHALPEWPNGYKEGENHLGVPVSHGCVRLSTEAAADVYAWVEVGTPIVIHS